MNYNLAHPFHEQACSHPERSALHVSDVSYSYSELAGLTARAACALGPARKVGVLASRTLGAYVGVLAACWRGAAYVPLSPKLPGERLARIFEIVGLDALIVDEISLSRLTPALRAVAPPLILDLSRPMDSLSTDRLLAPVHRESDDLAYILFTSGTTGAPKGVMISLGSVAQFLDAMRPRFHPVPSDRVSQTSELTFDVSVFEMFAFYYKLNKNQERIECLPPLDVVRDILALSPTEWKFPALEALIEVPFLRPSGTICDRPGYDLSTRLFYAPAPDLQLPEIPKAPTSDHLDAALDLLDSAMGDFPFADDASRANAIASMLTPVVRPAIDSPTPLALYDAPQAGTGKTLLAEVVAMISTGRAAETLSAPTDPEEWRKKITTALSNGTNVVLIDNVIRRLESDALCMALTATTISDRVFRTFDRIVLPVRCAWIATGNNIQLGGDMPRRCYWIRLDAKQSQPFRRTGFRHANLRVWVMDHRGELIAALLTIARYWLSQGRPKPKTLTPMGSFESWCETIGGMLENAGLDGFLANADTMLEQADSDAVQWEVFLLTLAGMFDGEPFRVTDIVEKMDARALALPGDGDSKRLREALPDFIADAADRTGGFFQRRLGKCFAERVGRRFGESQVFLERADEDRKAKVQRWRVVRQ